ncbi:MAG: PepSY domain-containing protein [Hyphomicrobiales bacterium]|nr:MAG: PepSY domain-containing protein [Hyphomicrobiales bacterium]
MKPWFLRLHRWLALAFSVPLLIVIATGLVLSIEPSLVVGAIKPGSITAEKLEALIARHDPGGQARAITLRSYDGTLTIGGGRGAQGTVVDVASGEKLAGPSPIAKLLGTTRGLHERLLLDADWLVITSTAVMLALIIVGILMGLPSFSNTLSGWHKGIAWVLLPLVILSPLTGLLMAMHVGGPKRGAAGPPAAESRPMRLPDALKALGREHDLSGLIWLRPMRGGETTARIAEDGEYRIYAVTPAGVTLQARNWPRLWHEGNFAGHITAGLNVVTSIALLLLLVTGVWIWARRSLRRRRKRAARAAPAAA